VRWSRARLDSRESEKVLSQEFRVLVDEYSARVLNIAVRILGDVDKAQDVHQDVFLAIWKRWHKYDARTHWDAYLYRATVRKAIELARRSRNQQPLGQQPEYATSVDAPDGPLRTSELQQKLARCLAKLPKRQAEVFVLSRMEGLKAEKVAELLGCSQRTVRVHLHRAVKRLVRELDEDLIA
jgi:RNA polymerase sigma-70 factor (ECF subfamily)